MYWAYTAHLIPRGLIGRTGKILGCRGLVLLQALPKKSLYAGTFWASGVSAQKVGSIPSSYMD